MKTKEDGLRVNIVLVKKEEGFFNKGEIELFLEMLPKREIHLTFYTSGKADVFVLAIDDEKNIFTCSPFEICKEMGINY
ncbi:hypothetical protein D3C80_2085150 [compost metagenome]